MGTFSGIDVRPRKRLSVAELGVKKKILTAVLVAVLVTLAVGVAGLRALSGTSASAQDLYRRNVANVGAVGAIKAAMIQARVDLANQASSVDPADTAKYTRGFTADVQAADAAMTAYGGQDQVLLADLRTNWRDYVRVARDDQLPAGAARDLASWQRTRDTVINPIFTRINRDLAELQAVEAAAAATSAAAARSDYLSRRTTVIVMLVVGCLLALGIGVAVTRPIVRSLSTVGDVRHASPTTT
ncbi:MCP four helix bundle domain-containing protein [Actinoplanes subtropicus]|uniref:MCP four helix bundle domain-containing protein n=1 Tax=Actinoplanes subtropicus TaxID=543632 RepID=UPI00068EE576|nr:MCP four helix bundle domain-containing protein [Actinoplanes subtropicus]